MKTVVAAFAVSALAASFLTPGAEELGRRLGAVSQPGGRHIHTHATSRLGGVAIALAFFVPLAGLLFVESSVAAVFRGELRRAIGLFLGGMILCLVGAIDDIRGIPATRKLLFQVAVAGLAFFCGFRIDVVFLPIVGNVAMGVFALPVTVLWIVGIINAVNLIDGLDGLAGGVVFFAGFTNFIVAYLAGSIFVALIMATLLGAVCGFLVYNFNPARIFMGDSGSYFLGYILGVTSLAGAAQKTSTTVSLLIPIVALGVPIFDTLFTMVRRFIEHRPIFTADRGHLHHRLLDMGLTQRRAVLVIYATCAAFAVAAIGISMGRSWQIGLALVIASAVMIGLVRFAGYFEYVHRMRRDRGSLQLAGPDRLMRAFSAFVEALTVATSSKQLIDAMQLMTREANLGSIRLVDVASDTPLIECISESDAGSGTGHLCSHPVGPAASASYRVEIVWQDAVNLVALQGTITTMTANVLCLYIEHFGLPRIEPDLTRPPQPVSAVAQPTAT